MKKRFIIALLLTVIITLVLVGCEKAESNENNSYNINKEDISPISRETVMNILKAEYGNNMIIKEDDIKLVGDLYIVDVYIDIEDSEDVDENENHENHVHEQNLGTHKIDKYTGEIISCD